VKVKESEQFNTTFTIPWGAYVYVRMPFFLTNASAKFQRAMDVAFSNLICIRMTLLHSPRRRIIVYTWKIFLSNP